MKHEKEIKPGLEGLRAPFPAHQISKLPKPTSRQTEEVKKDFKKGIRCRICGQWHHKDVVHLDYVGHAALTDRLLDCDPHWNWEPVGFDQHGQPITDESGGMWIKLTVCGQTRLGYGHADGKRGGDAKKEVIGDALRNAAMRFGAALDLWHKGDLHVADDQDDDQQDDDAQNAAPRPGQRREEPPAFNPRAAADRLITDIRKRKGDRPALSALWTDEKQTMADLPKDMFAEVEKEFRAAMPPKTPEPIDVDELNY